MAAASEPRNPVCLMPYTQACIYYAAYCVPLGKLVHLNLLTACACFLAVRVVAGDKGAAVISGMNWAHYLPGMS